MKTTLRIVMMVALLFGLAACNNSEPDMFDVTVMNERPISDSPGFGLRGTRVTRSILALPTTTIFASDMSFIHQNRIYIPRACSISWRVAVWLIASKALSFSELTRRPTAAKKRFFSCTLSKWACAQPLK